ncbi:hypothetical protein [Microvirga soli]|uniref:hypothetical protein n=1 Tax=Microvirga soli TaxID=1854496 RepID=UPI00191E5812|nr:hypothetical protein [Microvirga soli]
MQVLEQISSFAGADGSSMTTVLGEGARSWLASGRCRSVLGDWYAEGWHLQNTWAERASQRPRLQFISETDIFSPDEIETIPMYRDFIRPRGGGWSAGALMQVPNGGVVSFRFERPYSDGPMDQELRTRLNLLRPHLARSAFLLSNLGLRQARSTVSALQFMEIPAAVVTRNGRLLACNSAMESRLTQINIRAGDKIAFTDQTAQQGLSESLERITAGLFDQLRGPIALPATEQHEAAVAYLLPMRGAAQDLFSCETTLLLIQPARSENRLMDVVRTRFFIDAGEAQGWARLVAAAYPRLAAALLSSTENIQAILDGMLGRTRSGQEARIASLLWRLSDDPEYRLNAAAPVLLH